MSMRIMLSVILFFLWQTTVPGALTAQENKGKLERFEDANKGETSEEDEDDDEATEDYDDDGCFGSFIMELIFQGLFNGLFSGDGEESGYVDSLTDDDAAGWIETDTGLVYTGNRIPDAAVLMPSCSFGRYPYDPSGTIYASGIGKAFLGRISGSYQKLDDRTFGYRLNGQVQLARRHGLEFDFVDYREDLGRSTDHLQVFGLHYRYLIFGNDKVAVAPSAGIKIFQPDQLKDADVGLELAMALTWFFARPLSLNTRLAVAPIADEISGESSPTLFDLEFGIGAHLYYFELSGTYRTLIPSYNPDAALHGPELGLRIWF